MKPTDNVAGDPGEDVKTWLEEWAQDGDGSFRDHERLVAVWCALEQEGFNDIRLRREPYELPHNLWRFSARRGTHHRTFIDIESAIRRACKRLASVLHKEAVAAMVCGPRARGVFILPM